MSEALKLWSAAAAALALTLISGAWARDGVRRAGMLDEPPGLSAAEIVASKSLGGFRMVAVDLLWARAMDSWMRKEWHEAVASYEAITRLQPRQEPVWLFAAYTLSFDMAQALEEAGRSADARRVRLRGVALLDRGCRRNPNSARLAHAFAQLLYQIGSEAEAYAALTERYGDPLDRACASMRRAGALEPESYRHLFQLSILERARANRLGARRRFAEGLVAADAALAALARCQETIPGLTKDTAGLLHELTERRAALQDLKARLSAAASSASTRKQRP